MDLKLSSLKLSFSHGFETVRMDLKLASVVELISSTVHRPLIRDEISLMPNQFKIIPFCEVFEQKNDIKLTRIR